MIWWAPEIISLIERRPMTPSIAVAVTTNAS
jgi:hypothetical protein